MTIHSYFVLGCIILISSSSARPAETSDNLTNADLVLFQRHFQNLYETGGYTCENYEAKCTRSKILLVQNICQAFAKKYTCDNATDLEGTRKILKAIEKFVPNFVDINLKDLRKEVPKQ